MIAKLFQLLAILAALAMGAMGAQAQGPAGQGNNAKDTVAVMDLEAVGGTTHAQVVALTERLRGELLRTGHYTVVDRANMDKALAEQALQQQGCTSQECAVQVGKMLGVRRLVTGKVIKVDENLWQLSGAMIDVETSETLKSESVDHEGRFPAFLMNGPGQLVVLFEGGSRGPRVAAFNPGPAVALVAPVSLAPLPGGATWREPVTGLEFVRVPEGTFQMGCHPAAGDCSRKERPAHMVSLHSFWISRTEVTLGQWTQVMGKARSKYKSAPTLPADSVSWQDIQEFVRKLNERSPGAAVRLPSEAEWEFACRGGGKAVPYGTANGTLTPAAANIKGVTKAPVPVGSYPPNALGLYDMTGNVFEIVMDAQESYENGAAVDPVVGAHSGGRRVRRGGSWDSSPSLLRCTARDENERIGGSDSDTGFRLARTAP